MVSRTQVDKRMRALGLRAARKYNATTQSKHSLPVVPNLLGQDFTAYAPNRSWTAAQAGRRGGS